MNLEQLAEWLVSSQNELVFWSGVGFLSPDLPESLLSSVGQDWSADAARSYLSFLSVTSAEFVRPRSMLVVLAAPCHPGQLYGLTLLADAGLLSYVVLLEQRKPRTWTEAFEKDSSSTGQYLKDIGLADCGWVEWDASSKAIAKLDEAKDEALSDSPSFVVLCCRDQNASEEPIPLLRDPSTVERVSSFVATGAPEIQTVFGQFLKSLDTLVTRESLFWAPSKIDDLQEFRRRLALFRRIQQATPGRPIVVVGSSVLPVIYSDIREWCESPDRDNPIFLIYDSGLPNTSHHSIGGLSDGLLLLSVPGLNLAVPADEEEAKNLFLEADALAGPSALTFCQSPAVGLASVPTSKPGKGRTLREGKDAVLVALGPTVFPSLLAAESLRALGLSVAVVDLRYRRPLDKELLDGLNRFPLIVAIDEHPEAGGIAGHLWRPNSVSCKLVRLSIELEDIQSRMNTEIDEQLTLEHFGLHAEGIARVVRDNLRTVPSNTFT